MRGFYYRCLTVSAMSIEDLASSDTGDDEPSKLQQLILETAKENPDLEAEEIAEEVGAEPSQVFETFHKYDDPREDSGGDGLLWLLIIGGVLALLFFMGSQGDSGSSESLLFFLSSVGYSWRSSASRSPAR